jgi:CRP/FNR family transcriptional regulator, cyclic AMP receptor protein
METQEKIERLQSLGLFASLTEAKLEDLTRFMAVERVPAGTVVLEEGSTGDTMYLVAEGVVRIEKRVEAGGFKELALLSAGDLFGEMALIEETVRSARAVTVADATFFVLARRDLHGWLQSEPLMALGFVVELLRGLSHRLRRTSADLVLLYDVSHLVVRQFGDETQLLQEAVHCILRHLGEEGCGAAYLYNEYNDEVSRVAIAGTGAEALPETLPLRGSANRWMDAATFCVALPGKGETPLGFLLARSARALSPREKGELEVALRAAADLLSPAILNIRHEAEERLRARLEHQRMLS